MLKNVERCIANLEKACFVSSPSLQADVFPPLPAVPYTLFTSPFSSLKRLCRIPLEQGWNVHLVKTSLGQEGIVCVHLEIKGDFTWFQNQSRAVWPDSLPGQSKLSSLFCFQSGGAFVSAVGMLNFVSCVNTTEWLIVSSWFLFWRCGFGFFLVESSVCLLAFLKSTLIRLCCLN